MSQFLKNKKGFTLIELVIIIVIVALAIPPLMKMVSEGTQKSGDSELVSTATILAQDLMEEIKSKRWDENSPITGGTIVDASKTYPLGAEEASRTGYDDVDDYDGLANNPPNDAHGNPINDYTGFTRSVNVIYVAEANLNTDNPGVLPNPPVESDYKRIDVTVSWSTGSINLVTVVSNQ